MEVHKYLVNNRVIHYQFNQSNHKETIVFIHGAGSNRLQFQQQFDYFSQSFNVLNVSLYGHEPLSNNQGLKKEDFSLDQLAKDIENLLSELGLQSVYLVGNSAGGLVGLEMIKLGSNRIKRLITFGTAPKLMISKLMVKMVSGIDAKMLKKRPEKYLRFAAKACSKDEEVINEITNIMLQSKEAAPYIRSQIGRYDYVELICNIDIPYLILMGPYDKSINKVLKKYTKVFKENSHIKIKEIKESGHFLNMDQTEKFNQVVLDFLS